MTKTVADLINLKRNQKIKEIYIKIPTKQIAKNIKEIIF